MGAICRQTQNARFSDPAVAGFSEFTLPSLTERIKVSLPPQTIYDYESGIN